MIRHSGLPFYVAPNGSLHTAKAISVSKWAINKLQRQ